MSCTTCGWHLKRANSDPSHSVLTRVSYIQEMSGSRGKMAPSTKARDCTSSQMHQNWRVLALEGDSQIPAHLGGRGKVIMKQSSRGLVLKVDPGMLSRPLFFVHVTSGVRLSVSSYPRGNTAQLVCGKQYIWDER